MKYSHPWSIVVLAGVLAGCEPNYTSGKTQCSDKKECPSGFTCLDDGTASIHYCVDDKLLTSPGTGGRRDAGLGGAGGTGGSKDASTLCGTSCPLGQQCLSGQCCVPPAAGGNCTVYPPCGCPSGSVCYPSSNAHAMACYTSDNLAEGADCTGDRPASWDWVASEECASAIAPPIAIVPPSAACRAAIRPPGRPTVPTSWASWCVRGSAIPPIRNRPLPPW